MPEVRMPCEGNSWIKSKGSATGHGKDSACKLGRVEVQPSRAKYLKRSKLQGVFREKM